MYRIRRCLQCMKGIAGRLDKRFCDHQCRSNFHNKLYRDEVESMKKVNRILRRNRRILESVFLSGRSASDKTSLMMAGFDFDYFTHMHHLGEGDEYRFCYEYGYTFMDEEFIKLLYKKSMIL